VSAHPDVLGGPGRMLRPPVMDRRHRTRRALIPIIAFSGLAITALVLGVLSSSHAASRGHHITQRQQSASAAHDPLAGGRKVAFGINDQGAPPAEDISQVHRQTGLRPRVFMWYSDWSQPLFYTSQLKSVTSAGALPLITWDPAVGGSGIPLISIARGKYDRFLAQTATAARRWRGIIYIRFAHEMNLRGSAFGPGHSGNTPKLFGSAWRHVVSIFRAYRAMNVRWVWSPNVDCGGNCPFSAFWPGSGWVDWVALDGYNYSEIDGLPWETFPQVFSRSYREMAALTNKPMMIGETASAENGGDKAAWILGMASALTSQFRRIRVLIWFDRIKETDWRIDSSVASLIAFRAISALPLWR
jgi:glycosyl hydrolase family 26